MFQDAVFENRAMQEAAVLVEDGVRAGVGEDEGAPCRIGALGERDRLLGSPDRHEFSTDHEGDVRPQVHRYARFDGQRYAVADQGVFVQRIRAVGQRPRCVGLNRAAE